MPLRPYSLTANRFNDSLEGISIHIKIAACTVFYGPTAISKHNSIMKYKNSL